jgi:hypothetical protein
MVPSHYKAESSFVTQFCQLGKDSDRLSVPGSIRTGYHGLAVRSTQLRVGVFVKGKL